MKIYSYFLFFIVSLNYLALNKSYAQSDTEFWFAVPYVTKYHGAPNPILRIASKEVNEIAITQPGNIEGTGINLNLSIPAKSNHNIDLLPYINALTDSFPNKKGDNAIYIKSLNPITVYYDYASFSNSEIFSLKGNNALGSEFYIASQNSWHVDHNPDIGSVENSLGWWKGDANSTLDIVAIEDGTEIEITPKANGIDDDGIGNRTIRPANIKYTIVLNKGETYTLQAESTDMDKLLFGTHIKTVDPNKKIAVTIKDDSVKDGEGAQNESYAYDLIGDQLIPVNILGSQYIAMKGFTGNLKDGKRDKVFIVTTEANTALLVDGVNKGVFTKGDTVSFPISNDATFISSDLGQSFYVYQVTGFNNELASALLPPLKCTGSDTVSFVRSRKDNLVLSILVRKGGEGNFKINGNVGLIKASDFVAVGEEWLVARFDSASAVSLGIDSGKVTTISNDQYYFHLGVLEGKGKSFANFGYFSDFGKLDANYFSGDNLMVCHDSLPVFTVSNPMLTPTWNGAGSIFNEGRSFSPLAPGGKVVLTLSDKRGCQVKDSINIGFYNDIRVNLTGSGSKDSLICFGAEFNAIARVRNHTDPNAIEFFWQGNPIPVSTDSLIIKPNLGFDTTVYVKVKDVITGCLAFDTITVKQLPPVNLDLKDTTICPEARPFISASNPDFVAYKWQNGSTNFGFRLPAKQPGIYWVEVTTKNNCIKRDTFLVSNFIVKPFSLTFEDTIVCGNGKITINAGSGYASYLWSPGNSTDSTYNPEGSGNAIVKVTDLEGCMQSDTVGVTQVQIPKPNLGPDITLCAQDFEYFAYPGGASYKEYKWHDSSNLSYYEVNKNDRVIWVRVMNSMKNTVCYSSDTMVINFVEDCTNGIMTSRNLSQALNVFPNPGTNVVSVELPDLKGNSAVLSVYSIVGEKVFQEHLNEYVQSGAKEINISNFAPGLYILQFRMEKELYSGKFHKN